MRKTISEQIKFIREKTSLSQERFGKKIGLSGKTISAYENGKVIPPMKVLERISSTYNVNTMGIDSGKLEKLEGEIKRVQECLASIWQMIGVE